MSSFESKKNLRLELEDCYVLMNEQDLKIKELNNKLNSIENIIKNADKDKEPFVNVIFKLKEVIQENTSKITS